jgi:hypothetical protein
VIEEPEINPAVMKVNKLLAKESVSEEVTLPKVATLKSLMNK